MERLNLRDQFEIVDNSTLAIRDAQRAAIRMGQSDVPC